MLQRRWAVVLAGVALCGLSAAADDLTPMVVASIHDAPPDGQGDSFNNSPFEGLLRQTSSQEDRAIQEYDVSAYSGMTVSSATISGTIYVNNGGGTWPRVFDFILYDGNGQADLTDFQIPGTVVGTETWQQDSGPLAFSFDVTATVQALLDGGAQYVGLKVDPTSANSFPSILSEDDALLTIEASECPGDLDGDGDTDQSDLGILLADWGCDDPVNGCNGDLDGDDDTDQSDLGILLADWGCGG
jgi:hypothetical protein